MTNVLLSCGCRRKYSPPPLAGDLLICPTHDVVGVIPGRLHATCDDCDYVRDNSYLAPMSLCTNVTKHAISKGHNASHQTEVDSSDRMCLHHHREALEFTAGAPPF
jgi:hypothetical protein